MKCRFLPLLFAFLSSSAFSFTDYQVESLDLSENSLFQSSCSVGSLTIPRKDKDPLVIPGCSISCTNGKEAVCRAPRRRGLYYYEDAVCKCAESTF